MSFDLNAIKTRAAGTAQEMIGIAQDAASTIAIVAKPHVNKTIALATFHFNDVINTVTKYANKAVKLIKSGEAVEIIQSSLNKNIKKINEIYEENIAPQVEKTLAKMDELNKKITDRILPQIEEAKRKINQLSEDALKTANRIKQEMLEKATPLMNRAIEMLKPIVDRIIEEIKKAIQSLKAHRAS